MIKMREQKNYLALELKDHVPFTLFGALTGIIIMIILFYGNFLPKIYPFSENIFYILHPVHIFFSAIVTTSIFLKYNKNNLILAVIIGYTGSIGIATISDSIIPFFGELFLDLPNTEIHLGFIEKPLFTNIPAFIGILLSNYKGFTKFPHSGHVLISTWASLFHIIMAIGLSISTFQFVLIFIFLFFAVWFPCCTSDIIYPIIFKKNK